MTRLDLAILGCGSRGRTYAALAAGRPDRWRLTAAADPVAVRSAAIGAERQYASAEGLFAAGRVADVLVIATQDSQHREHALRALELGYDLLLEKPIADNPSAVLEIAAAAARLRRRVVVCHVLRYAPLFRLVHRLLHEGAIGELQVINAVEGVDPWHFAHSFVRGHWSVGARCTPMIVAKSCHDTDLLSWLADRPVRSVSSSGSLEFFTASRAPADAPARCTDGCPHAATCPYDAQRYLREQKGWLGNVMDGAASASDEVIRTWLASSSWGRCAWRCDNDAVDRQVVSIDYAGGLRATLTMTAFARGRSLDLMGTTGRLIAGEWLGRETGCDAIVLPHDGGPAIRYNAGEGAGGHGGGDAGLMEDLHAAMTASDPDAAATAIARSLDGHLVAFAADEARRTGTVVDLAAFAARFNGYR